MKEYSIMTKLRIKELCKERGMTQAALAGKLGIKPISFSQAVSRNNFDMEYLGRIAGALGVGITELFQKPKQFVALVRSDEDVFAFDTAEALERWLSARKEEGNG